MSAAPGLPRTTVTAEASAATLRLYERYGQRVLTFCLSRLSDREEAQDAAQTTFVYVLRALERGVVPRHELAWLLRIAENVCHSSRRSLGRRMAVTSSADVTELEAAAASLSVETSEQLGYLRAGLELLPENQRRAILLREWQGLSYAEIADELHLSVPAVEALLFRARRAMAAYLERTRTRLGALDLGSSLVALRALLKGGPAKMAVATAAVAVASAPALVREERHATAANARKAAAGSVVAGPRAIESVPLPAGSIRGPVRVRAKADSAPTAERNRLAREAAGRIVTPTGAAPAAETSAPPVAEAAPRTPPTVPVSPPDVPAPAAPPPVAVPPEVQPVAAVVTTVVEAVDPPGVPVVGQALPPVPVR